MLRRDFVKGVGLAGVAALARPVAALPDARSTVVQTALGPVAGYAASASVAGFKGIPYGANTATTRFAAPRAASAWTSVLPCRAWATKAPQVPGARQEPVLTAEDAARFEAARAQRPGYFLPVDIGRESEDCLHLNVWTPQNLDTPKKQWKRRPVMVYIHGGAYSNGTVNAALYDGTRLAERGDVVVVTVNHRLNIFGYLYLAELLPGQGFEDSGNAGQLDLVMALAWVRDNIARFGGDPANVLIFGQSGGGAKCATLMAQPPAHGLFHRVISMSGQQVTGATPAHATERAKAALDFLKIDTKNASAAAAKLRSLPWETLAGACKAHGYFGPVTDGRSLPHNPFAPDAAPLSQRVPMMLGNAHDETRLLLGGGQPALFALTWETLPAALEKNAPFLHSATISLPVAEVIAKYRAWHPEYSASDVFFAVTTDSRSWRGEVIEAERRAADPVAQPRTWVYQVNWRSPVDGGKFRAPHTMDIPFAFDNVALAPGMVGSSADEQLRAQKMADVVRMRFVEFARSGSVSWPAFSVARRETMIFDDDSRVENDPRGAERRYLGQVPYVQPGT